MVKKNKISNINIIMIFLLLMMLFFVIAHLTGDYEEIEVKCYDRANNPINGLTCTENIYCEDNFFKFLNNVGCENK